MRAGDARAVTVAAGRPGPEAMLLQSYSPCAWPAATELAPPWSFGHDTFHWRCATQEVYCGGARRRRAGGVNAWTNGGAAEFLHLLTGAVEHDEGDAVTFRAKRRGGERPRRCDGASRPSAEATRWPYSRQGELDSSEVRDSTNASPPTCLPLFLTRRYFCLEWLRGLGSALNAQDEAKVTA
jgi:hypothetical protein